MEFVPGLHQLISRQSDGTKQLLDLLLGTSVGFTILLAVGFSLLRPFNSVVYAPKLRVADDKHAPPALGRGVFAWVTPVLRTREADLIMNIGMDATVFLRVLRMCRNIFLVLTGLGCAILIPTNLIKGQKFPNTDIVTMVTPVNTFGSANWAITICAWLFNSVVAGYLWWNYRAVLRLRRQYYESPEYQASLHARTLMINDIPKNMRSDEGIGRLIDKVVPTSSFSRTAVARNVKDLPDLIEDHNQTVRQLERTLAKHLKVASKLPPKRPECYPSKKDPSSKTYPKGQKIDAIEYLTNRIKQLETEVKEVRLTVDRRNPLPYGFASFDEIEEAHSIAHSARKKHPDGTTIVLAPRPNDIIWKNMPLTPHQRRIRRLWNNLWTFLLTLVWIAPNALISIFLVSLANLAHVWSAFADSLAAHTTWWAIVQGIASPAVTSLVYLVLPMIFRRMMVRAGDRTKTARERHVAGKLYTFFVVNFLIVFSGFSTVWAFVSTVIQNTSTGKDAWTAIKEADVALALFISLCRVSPFWITWLLQRNLGAAVDLAQLWSLLWSFCARKFSSPTPREMIELTAPPAFDYASYYNYFLFYSTVTLCFGYLQPLCLPACALYFCLDVYLKKYLLLYIFITKTESGGMFWRMFFNRMVFAAMLSNCVVFLAVWVHGDGAKMEAYLVIPLPFLMLAFKWYCKRTFDDKIHYYSVRHKLHDPEATRANVFAGKKNKLATRFGHPALYKLLITPMVHAKAQNMLASVYGGRLSDSNAPGTMESGSVSGYSDMFVLDNMQTPGADGVGRTANAIPNGIEIVPESKLDFEHYKNRAEFGDEHGNHGGLWGNAEDIIRPDTPGSQSLWSGSDFSRPGNPHDPGVPRSACPPVPVSGPYAGQVPVSYDGHGDIGTSHHPLHRQESWDQLVSAASEMGNTPAYERHQSEEQRAPLVGGFMGGGRGGYGGLPQEDAEEEVHDPMSYDYFRGRRQG
ncbi:hypothetical protein BJ878DRAFT_476161 [Calycina marina]|uniref:DUF221-domain-containing protein n=1 Tax=Calycina marina TaxID=1763456 RepID=A0A9P7ZB23_9HELO|nr:hypothetical protein BJ878DRAFT_476161 [Calycina marina]